MNWSERHADTLEIFLSFRVRGRYRGSMSHVVQMPDPGGLVVAVAANVRVECALKGWKQADLAAALRVSPSAVNVRWMGRRQWQLEDLEAIAKVMQIPVSRLLLPRLDSNQEPSDSPFALVIDMFTGERVA